MFFYHQQSHPYMSLDPRIGWLLLRPCIRALLLLLLISRACSLLAFTCEELPTETPLEVRLLTPVSSYSSHAGDSIHAILTDDVVCDGSRTLPAGSKVEGNVVHVRKVGLGIRHETAALRLDFNQIVIADSTIPIKSRLVEVYDARENVTNGAVQGIRGTDTPQGRINSRLKYLPTWNPYTDTFLIAYKLTFPIFPEPEIYFGPGTDLELQLVAPVVLPHVPSKPDPFVAFTPAELVQIDDIAARVPERTQTMDHKDADIINIAFIGTRETIDRAFAAAGWVGTAKFSKTAFLKEFHAFLANGSYTEAPMRPMLLGESKPDLLWQKSLNTYSKRDHFRAWRWSEDIGGTPVWVGATTHDVGATLSVRYKRFVHHIEPNVDQERAKVIRDLKLAGCVESLYLAPRAQFPTGLENATGDPIHTDGAIAFVRLQNCSASALPADVKQFHAGNRVFRYFRQEILIARSDIWRANIIYGTFDFGRLLRSAFRNPEKQLVHIDEPELPSPAPAPVMAGTLFDVH